MLPLILYCECSGLFRNFYGTYMQNNLNSFICQTAYALHSAPSVNDNINMCYVSIYN